MMTKSNGKLVRVICFLVLVMMLAATVLDVSAQTRRRARRRVPARVVTPYYTIPADTVIRVRMDTELNGKTARIGDRFSTSVTEPVYGGSSGVDVIPVGSKVWGRVTSTPELPP